MRPNRQTQLRGSSLSLKSGQKKYISFSPCCRNSFFVVLHLILEGLVYGEYTWEVFGYCQELQFSRLVLLLPYPLLAVNAAFFILCSKSNPGEALFLASSALAHLHCPGWAADRAPMPAVWLWTEQAMVWGKACSLSTPVVLP